MEISRSLNFCSPQMKIWAVCSSMSCILQVMVHAKVPCYSATEMTAIDLTAGGKLKRAVWAVRCITWVRRSNQ